MSWYVYMVRCSDNSLYTGSTNDLSHRIQVHNSGKGAKYTQSRLPVTLVYREECPDKSAALKRECAIKKLSKAKKEQLAVEASCLEIATSALWASSQ